MKALRVLCTIFCLLSKGETTFKIGQSHLALFDNVKKVYINKIPLNFHINHLDTLLALKLPSRNFISKLSNSFSKSSKLDVHISDILKDAKHLSKLSSSFNVKKANQVCYLANIELVIVELIDKILKLNDKEKRDINNVSYKSTVNFIREKRNNVIDTTDAKYIDIFNEFETSLNTILNSKDKTLQQENFVVLYNEVQSYKTLESTTVLYSIRLKLSCLVKNKLIESMQIIFFVIMKDTPIITLDNLLKIKSYSLNRLRRLSLQSLVSAKTTNINNIEDILKDIDCDNNELNNSIQEQEDNTTIEPIIPETTSEHSPKNSGNNIVNDNENSNILSQSNIDGKGAQLDYSQDIVELNQLQKTLQGTINENEKQFLLTEKLQNRGILCSTPYIKDSCKIIRSKLKQSLKTHFDLDEKTIETMNIDDQTTLNHLAEEISKMQSNKISNKFSTLFIFNEKESLMDFEIINEFLYKSTNVKEDFIVSQLTQLENTLKFLIIEFVNLNNGNNNIIDKEFYKNCIGLSSTTDVAIIDKKMFTFENVLENQNVFKILPFCGTQSCFKLNHKDVISINYDNKNQFCSLDIISNKIAFCSTIIDDIDNCVFEKRQTDMCKFKKINVKMNYELYDNLIYHCSSIECAYFKFSKQVSNQYVSSQEFIENFDNTFLDNSSFFKENEDVLIQAAVSFILLLLFALLIKCFKHCLKATKYCLNSICKCNCFKNNNNTSRRNRANLRTMPDLELNPLAL